MHARRQWNLVDDGLLRYSLLNEFDRQMHALEEKYHWLNSEDLYVSTKHEDDKVDTFLDSFVRYALFDQRILNFCWHFFYVSSLFGLSLSLFYKIVAFIEFVGLIVVTVLLLVLQ